MFGQDRFPSSGRNSCISIIDYENASPVSCVRDRTSDHSMRTDNDGSNKKDTSHGPYHVPRYLCTQTPSELSETTHNSRGHVDQELLVLHYSTDPEPDRVDM